MIYPILQKYYSALKHTKGLTADNSLFDCISSLDSFFSEFRSITFVMQKQFSGQEEKKFYETLRDRYLTAPHMRWFIDKRNETTKQSPFALEKKITVEIYSDGDVLTLKRDAITVEGNTSTDEIKGELLDLLAPLSENGEVFFSVRLSLQENGADIDVVNLLHEGIGTMDDFLHDVMMHYPCNCSKCRQLQELIKETLHTIAATVLSFVWDASIYKQEIEWGVREEIYFLDGSASAILHPGTKPIPVERFFNGRTPSNTIELFAGLSFMQAMIYKMQGFEWTPTFYMLNKDNTMNMRSFMFTSKSTLYRKAIEIAEEIKKGEIQAVIFYGEFYLYLAGSYDTLPETYNDRVARSEKVAFSCDLIGKSATDSYSLYLYPEDIEDEDKLSQAIKEQLNKDSRSYITIWSTPIQQSLMEAFSQSVD